MSLYDKASLVQIPSGVKSGTLYSVLPNTADGDFTHSRGSSGTRVNKDGLIETVAANTPRLDYPLIDGVVQSCPTLLLEPSRKNLQIRSEEFDNVAWGKSNVSITANNIVSPDGSQTADKCTVTVSGSNQAPNIFSQSGYQTSVTSGTSYSFSYFAKAGNTDYAKLRISGSGFTTYSNDVIFNTTTGNIISGDATIDVLTNGWVRIKAVATANADGYGVLAIDVPDKNGNWSTGSSFDGDEFIYIWGAMIEQGSYPTSYIKNIDTSAGVTRSADVCNGAGTSDTFNDSEGVLFAEIQALANDNTYREISISDSTSSNRVELRYTVTDNQIQVVLRVGSVTQCSLPFIASDLLSFNKCLLKYKENDFAFWVNGFEVATDTSGSTYSSGTLTELAFDRGDGAARLYGNTKQLMTFNEALSDSELETLTSWDSFNDMAKGQLYTIE